ncbi:MAG: HxlR family transcriptional regulator [Gammaproteobacteria bacterium]|nr:MAG: HxlR family transcriptional regulator [Gammaproteobacteria bacterium]
MDNWDIYNKNCPTRQVLNRIADKWTVLIVGALAQRTKRFSELKKEIDGISQKMLTQTLRGMERDGLISRKVYPTVPPKVEYTLTDLAMSLISMLGEIRQWSEGNIETVIQAQQRYDNREVEVH